MQRIWSTRDVKQDQPTLDPNPERWSTEDARLIPTGIRVQWEWLHSDDFSAFPEFLLEQGPQLLEVQACYKRPAQSSVPAENIT